MKRCVSLVCVQYEYIYITCTFILNTKETRHRAQDCINAAAYLKSLIVLFFKSPLVFNSCKKKKYLRGAWLQNILLYYHFDFESALAKGYCPRQYEYAHSAVQLKITKNIFSFRTQSICQVHLLIVRFAFFFALACFFFFFC